jgi:hypothetical protein
MRIVKDSHPGSDERPLRPGPAAYRDVDTGITVEEQELRLIRAQRMYQLRCDCGRSWFELALPRLSQSRTGDGMSSSERTLGAGQRRQRPTP